MLVGDNLSKCYTTGARRVEAVVELSLEIQAGQFVAIVGRSGSGKSTLLGMLGGLCRPTSGAVQIDGTDLWSLADDARTVFLNRHIGFVFQFASLLPTLRAVDNVALPALLGVHGGKIDARGRAAELLIQLGLADRLDAYPTELSGGEQRRVALARALINAPPLLLADEPTGDLDEDTEAEIMSLLLDRCRSQGTTLLLVTHNRALAAQADQVLHIRQGRLADITVAPKPVAESLMSRLPAVEPSVPASPPPVTRPVGARLLAWALAAVLATLATDQGIALYQRRQQSGREAARVSRERAALFQLRADVDNLAYGPDGTYALRLYLDNLDPTEPLHVLAPTVRVYIQVGLLWQEVPCRPADDQEGRVLSINGRRSFAFVFEPQVKDFEELIPGYMHVRIQNAMLVSRRADPKGDLVERVDDYYVYLLPHQPDERKVSQNRFPGKAPLWIPMPPH